MAHSDFNEIPVALAMSMTHVRIIRAILTERHAQDAKWGEQNWPDGTHDEITARHYRDWCRQAADAHYADDSLTWADILNEEVAEALAEEDPAKLRAELVQVAAVCVCWLEALDRRAQQ